MVMFLAFALTSACIEQKQDEPKPAAPVAPPAPPPEPPRSAMAISPTTSYSIVAVASNKCLQYVAGAPQGARAEIRTCDGGKPQLFTLRPVAGGYQEIVNALTNDCMGVTAFVLDEGGTVVRWVCDGGANQQWIVADAGPDAIRLVARHSGKVLGVEDSKSADGTLVSQYSWTSGANQRFKLQAVGGKPPENKGKGDVGGAGGKSGKAGKTKKGGGGGGKSPPAAAKP
jgi:hypothetical protein